MFCLSVLTEPVGGCFMQRICFKKGKMLDPSKLVTNQWETLRYWQKKKFVLFKYILISCEIKFAFLLG